MSVTGPVGAVGAAPLVGKVTAKTQAVHANSEPDAGLKQTVKNAFKNPSYGLLHAGFFTCGFHIAFLVTHLPGEVDLCGLPPSVASWSLAIIGLSNIAGSLLVGTAISKYRSKMILALMYASRAALSATAMGTVKICAPIVSCSFQPNPLVVP